MIIWLCKSIEALCVVVAFELCSFKLVVSTAPADGLALDGARASAGTMVINDGFRI